MGELLSFVFSSDGTLISASAAPHRGGGGRAGWCGWGGGDGDMSDDSAEGYLIQESFLPVPNTKDQITGKKLPHSYGLSTANS